MMLVLIPMLAATVNLGGLGFATIPPEPVEPVEIAQCYNSGYCDPIITWVADACSIESREFPGPECDPYSNPWPDPAPRPGPGRD